MKEERADGKKGSEHSKDQGLGRKRDLNICQVRGSRVRAQGHHFIDFHFGGAANVENIITLCQRCYNQVYRGKMFYFNF